MEHFWTEVTEHFQSALQKAERLGKKDLKNLAEIPEILTYLKGLDGDDLLLLVDHAKKIRKRNHPNIKSASNDFFHCQNLLEKEDQQLFNKVQAGLRLEIVAFGDEHRKTAQF